MTKKKCPIAKRVFMIFPSGKRVPVKGNTVHIDGFINININGRWYSYDLTPASLVLGDTYNISYKMEVG